MQRCVANQNSGDLYWLQTRYRRDGASTANLKLDVAHESHLLLGRKLKRHCPARRAGHETKLLLEIKRIHFDNHTVDIKPQIRPIFFNFAIVSKHFLWRMAELYTLANRQPPELKLLQAR